MVKVFPRANLFKTTLGNLTPNQNCGVVNYNSVKTTPPEKVCLILTPSNYRFTPGNIALGNCMDIITLGNLTLVKYTLVAFTLGNLALSLNNHTPETQVLQQR